MNHYDRLQNAINFIEDNLDKSFSLTDVSNSAFSSLSYFHRIFYFMTGYTLKEYIRKRRLSHSVYQLHSSKLSITEIAFNAGYETLESFTRAFKKNFGVNPRKFRELNQECVLFEKLDIFKKYATQIDSHLDFKLDLEYVLYKESSILGLQIHTTLEGGQQAIDICHFANETLSTGKLAKFFDLGQTPVFGVYTNMTDENEFYYTIGCLERSNIKPSKQLVKHTIPTSTYAKFSLDRTDRIKEAWHYIYGTWFPQNQRYRSTGYDFEIYYPNSVDIYIPMQKFS
jgi:AraC family transcriptional regulator